MSRNEIRTYSILFYSLLSLYTYKQAVVHWLLTVTDTRKQKLQDWRVTGGKAGLQRTSIITTALSTSTLRPPTGYIRPQYLNRTLTTCSGCWQQGNNTQHLSLSLTPSTHSLEDQRQQVGKGAPMAQGYRRRRFQHKPGCGCRLPHRWWCEGQYSSSIAVQFQATDGT